MERLMWSDNICTVGWTSIHAWMTPDDMDWLIMMQPEGNFTPTFSPPWSSWAHVTSDLVRQYFKDGMERAFYFSFPEDRNGEVLLIALKLKGMEGDRWKSANPEWKRKREQMKAT
jgi:hypothetical protein